MRQEYTHSTQLKNIPHFFLCVCSTNIHACMYVCISILQNTQALSIRCYDSLSLFLSISSSTSPFNSPTQTCLFLQLTRLHLLKHTYLQTQGSIFLLIPCSKHVGSYGRMWKDTSVGYGYTTTFSSSFLYFLLKQFLLFLWLGVLLLSLESEENI